MLFSFPCFIYPLSITGYLSNIHINIIRYSLNVMFWLVDGIIQNVSDYILSYIFTLQMLQSYQRKESGKIFLHEADFRAHLCQGYVNRNQFSITVWFQGTYRFWRASTKWEMDKDLLKVICIHYRAFILKPENIWSPGDAQTAEGKDSHVSILQKFGFLKPFR